MAKGKVLLNGAFQPQPGPSSSSFVIKVSKSTLPCRKSLGFPKCTLCGRIMQGHKKKFCPETKKSTFYPFKNTIFNDFEDF